MGPTTFGVLILCSVSAAILVPTDWSESDVNQKLKLPNEDIVTFSDAQFISETPEAPIPVEYFQYPANKPQFAVDVAAFHGVKNPEKHYSAYPVRPYTGLEKPVLGQHKILNEHNPVFEPFQQFAQINDDDTESVTTNLANYEVFHPYKAEEPALQELYKDPVLEKIRNDIYNSQNRLQKYEKEAGEPDIKKDEHLENPEETDRRKFPIKNVPVPYEVHRPQRRPVYYRPPPYSNRDYYLNRRFRHPWNQQNAKIRPLHYRPLRTHLQRLRQNQAIKYDDEHNEYPQVPTHEQLNEVPEGYDIYKRGKEKYVALRNNVDESINNAVQQNGPLTYQKIELQNNDSGPKDENDEFIPIKNYAQVRKTETTRHLPKSAALDEAVSFDELKNAPRLREAIKSTKAQTVYTEEGYEDAAYDHEGEEKHAAENEAHAGQLKEKEISGGKYKTPSESQKYQDASGTVYRDQNLRGEKWKNDDKEKEKEASEEDYDDDETEQSIEAEIYDEVNGGRDKRGNKSIEKNESSTEIEENNSKESTIERSKRENKPELINHSSDIGNETSKDSFTALDINKRENDFKVPEINLNTTFLSHEELLKKAKFEKLKEQLKKSSIKEKYPYYYKNLKSLSKDSPLRYSENMKFIPKKSKGGTEFYDSRSRILECPEVDEEVDALPEKLKKQGHPNESEESDEETDASKSTQKADFSQLKKNRRLQHLGDKIDCFKAKFFGTNPLDSPFFKEGIIANPEPITVPNLPIYKLKSKVPLTQASTVNNLLNISEILKENTKFNVLGLFDKLQSDQKTLQESLSKTNQELRLKLPVPQNISIISNPQSAQQENVYNDVLATINSNQQPTTVQTGNTFKELPTQNKSQTANENVTYTSYHNKEDVTKLPSFVRKRRAAPFIYEPYKVIKDVQMYESKKTTTTNNVSPLIKQLQSSKIYDRLNSFEEKDQPVKRNAPAKMYKDIGRREREKNAKPDIHGPEFVEIKFDGRRGEPRYEIRMSNHKSRYTPVENKKAMKPEDYEKLTNKTAHVLKGTENVNNDSLRSKLRNVPITKQIKSTVRPYFDVSQYLPKIVDSQKPSASNTVSQVVQKPSVVSQVVQKPSVVRDSSNRPEQTSQSSSEEEDDDYEEYDDENKTTTTTTTSKPSFKRRKLITTTTPKPENEEVNEEEAQEFPKLRLITRFNTTPLPRRTTPRQQESTTQAPVTNIYEEDRETESPKYREKKKKSSKSTSVTDTESYDKGNSNTDMMKDEIDAMIGVKQDMEDYKPNYEREIENKAIKPSVSSESSEEYDDDGYGEDSDEISDEDDEEIEEDESGSSEVEHEVTSRQPNEQTLSITTEAPVSTTEARSAKLERRPIIHKKKIEIHKELPYNKSLPHTTHFKQDIKEVEIIKEMPSRPRAFQKTSRRKPQKNLEAFELYKDDKLAEEVNKLGAVEVFKQNLDLRTGPKHGGNYKSAQLVELQKPNSTVALLNKGNLKGADAEVSQSQNEKLIDSSEMLPARRHNGFRTRSRNTNRNSRLELEDSKPNTRKLHGGNLKSIREKGNRDGSRKSEKLTELDEDEDRSDSREDTHESNFKSYGDTRSSGRSLHGGNYRSSKLVQKDDIEKKAMSSREMNDLSQNPRTTAAVLLNTFVQAAPHLTTTPAYILDPSKRMYYYVDAER